MIRLQQTSSRILIQTAELLIGRSGLSNEDVPVPIISHDGDEVARVALAFLEGLRLVMGNAIWEFCGAKALLNEDCLSERLTYQIWEDRANGQTCRAWNVICIIHLRAIVVANGLHDWQCTSGVCTTTDAGAWDAGKDAVREGLEL